LPSQVFHLKKQGTLNGQVMKFRKVFLHYILERDFRKMHLHLYGVGAKLRRVLNQPRGEFFAAVGVAAKFLLLLLP